MFTTVIFFLILSTSFFGFTKLTLPPSKVSVNTDPLTPPPLSTKFVIGPDQGDFRLRLSWVGAEPGERIKTVSAEEIEKTSAALAAEFVGRYPREKTVQLGLASGVNYQALVRAMDGLREKLPDIVLISPEEAEVRLAARGAEAAK